MDFLLFQSPAHLTDQFVEKLSHGAVVEVAGTALIAPPASRVISLGM
jgi:hypothetical protein